MLGLYFLYLTTPEDTPTPTLLLTPDQRRFRGKLTYL